MADAYESLELGDIVVTRPRNNGAPSAGWAPMLLVSHFRDDDGRRWAVATPLRPAHGPKSLRVAGLPTQVSHTNLHTPLSTSMEAQADQFAFLPLFQGPAPFLRKPGGDGLAWGNLHDLFAVRDVHKLVLDAHARGIEGYRVGMADPEPVRGPVPTKPAQTAHMPTAEALPTPLRQAQALGAAKADAHIDSVPLAQPFARGQAPKAYGIPVATKPTVSITL